ncbi:MAG: hypothetical protein QOI63_1479 [Thermoplasmata archaeon]|nr:hypothetical protein [Thermoplasmata archaeon]
MAVLVLTAILFFTSVQRPTSGSESRGQDLGQVATDTLGILQRRQFTVLQDAACPAATPPAVPLDLEGWATRVLQGDCNTAATVDRFLDDILPGGAHHLLRLSNGVGSLVLLPTPAHDPGTPQGARAAQLPFFPHWGSFNANLPNGASAAAQFASAGAAVAAGTVPDQFTDSAAAITCIQSPDGSTTGPGGTAWDSATYWSAVRGTVPTWALAGVWKAGTTTTNGACTGTISYLAVALSGSRAAAGLGTTSGSAVVSGATAVFTKADVGTVLVAAGVPAGATVTTVGRTIGDGAITFVSPNTFLNSVTAAFTANDVGAPVSGNGIPAGTTISAFNSATKVTLSSAATVAAGLTVSIASPYQATLDKTATATASGLAGTLFPSPVYPLYGLQLVVWFGA